MFWGSLIMQINCLFFKSYYELNKDKGTDLCSNTCSVLVIKDDSFVKQNNIPREFSVVLRKPFRASRFYNNPFSSGAKFNAPQGEVVPKIWFVVENIKHCILAQFLLANYCWYSTVSLMKIFCRAQRFLLANYCMQTSI